uniref:Uncharacterized protein n=1 Tax=viral metagenome TaxID=1070528 RepID=A0A6C0JP02_9ZZZZ
MSHYWNKPKSAYSSGSYSLGKHIYEIQLLKRIQEQTRIQEEQRKELEEERKMLDRLKMDKTQETHRKESQRQEAQRQEAQRQKDQEAHIARINCMSEEEKNRLYKQMIKEREDDKRDYILKYGFDKWEKWQRYKLEHDL